MKIAQLAPVWVRVPPEFYGGIEAVVSLLTEELVRKGHNVTLFASGDSRTKARLKWVYPKAPGFKDIDPRYFLTHAVEAFRHADEFDIIHNHCGLPGIALAEFVKTPVLTTLHNNYFLPQYKPFFEMFKDTQYYNSISNSQRREMPGLNYVKTVYNAIDVSFYKFERKKSDYLLSLGNLWEVKGTDLAIEVAKRLGMKLIIAGKLDPKGHQFFNEKVKPHIDNKQIIFTGEVTQEKKRDLFAHAKAFLFPIRWEEAFGLVMVEAMASGTPVVAFNHGSVPEIVEDGKTGYIVNNVDEMVKAVKKIDKISPDACRQEVEKRFSPHRMASDYLTVYQEILEREAGRRSQAASY